MRQFAACYPTPEFVQQAVGQLPWGQNILLFQIKDPIEREWYARKVLEEGWARKDLLKAISSSLYQAQGQAGHKVSNYLARLPPPQSSLAQETLKDPYKFHFITVGEDAEEKKVEQKLVHHVTDLLNFYLSNEIISQSSALPRNN